MLVVTEGTLASGAERAVREHLATLQEVPALAVFDVRATKKPGEPSRQIDALIWTPRTCVAVEIKGFKSRQNGALIAPANGRWTIDGAHVDLHTGENSTPFKQIENATLAVKGHLARRTNSTPWVDGLVCLVPLPDTQITIAEQEPPPGTRAVIADAADDWRDLDAVLTNFATTKPTRWSAADVERALRALNIAGDIDAHTLLAHGFPATADLRSAVSSAGEPAPPLNAAVRDQQRWNPEVVGAAAAPLTPPLSAPSAPGTSTTTVSSSEQLPTIAVAATDERAASTIDEDPPVAAVHAAPVSPPPQSTAMSRRRRKSWERVTAACRTRLRDRRRDRQQRRRDRQYWGQPSLLQQRAFFGLGVVAASAVVAGLCVAGVNMVVALADAMRMSSSSGGFTPVAFQDSTGGIGCAIGTDADGDFVRCDVASYSYPLPSRPADCAPQDWGHTVLLRKDQMPKFACAADYLLATPLPTAGAGNTTTAGPFSCTLDTGAVITCRQTSRRQGFTISTQAVEFGRR